MHHAAKSTPRSWSASSTLPAAWARSQPTWAPAACPAAVRRSTSWACPVAKLTPARKTTATDGPFSCDRRLEIVRPDSRLAVPRPDDDQVCVRVETARRQVARQRVTVGREEWAVGQDPASRADGTEERGQQEVDVRGQAEHQPDLRGSGADDPGHRRTKGVVHREPRSVGREPGVDPEARPGIELGLDRGADGPRLEAERLARVVDGRCPVGRGREQEPVAERGQRIGGVVGERLRLSLGRRAAGVGSGHLGAPLLVGSGRPRVASADA